MFLEVTNTNFCLLEQYYQTSVNMYRQCFFRNSIIKAMIQLYLKKIVYVHY